MIEIRLAWPRGRFALDVDLRLPAQGVSALFGASGSGKTTLLRCLAGLEAPGSGASGRIAVDGEVWQDSARGLWLPPHRRPVALVFQDSNLFDHLDVRANIAFGWQRLRAHERRVSLDDAIALLGVEPLLARRPASLSGGERQRVAIARALAVSPRLLLLDEPLASLDGAARAAILPALERLREALALPVIYVSHAMDEVARLADHLVLLDGGRVVAEGPVGELLARPDLPLPLGEELGVMLPARLATRDAEWHLARLDVDGAGIWARDPGGALGRALRVRVLARDVALALQAPADTSILNQWPVRVEALADDAHPAQLLVRLRLGADGQGGALLARITRRSAMALKLAPGTVLCALVKSVAVVD